VDGWAFLAGLRVEAPRELIFFWGGAHTWGGLETSGPHGRECQEKFGSGSRNVGPGRRTGVASGVLSRVGGVLVKEGNGYLLSVCLRLKNLLNTDLGMSLYLRVQV
jgi:hypothetical protein